LDSTVLLHEVCILSERMIELERILLEVKESTEVSKDTRKFFWKLVREIKRARNPDISEIKIATQIRNILFNINRGRTYSIGPFVAAETILGILAFVLYLHALNTPVSWLNFLSWGFPEIITVFLRFLGIFLMIAFFYPYGRLIAGTVFGIRLEAIWFSDNKEPGLKIDYETFLLANPSQRKWFFFFAGLWTMITAVGTGLIGWYIAGDILGFIIGVFFIGFYGYVIGTGVTYPNRGEMSQYNREKKIERAWKRKLG